MTLPQTPAAAHAPEAAAGTTPRRDRPTGNAGSGPCLVSDGADVAQGAGEAPQSTSAPELQYAVRYTAPEAFAGTVAHIRHHKSTAEAMCRSENDHPQHPDLRCHVVTRTVTYGEWAPTETESR